MMWTAKDQTGDLLAAIAYFNSKLPGWWFSVGACHVSADATVCPDTAGMDAMLFESGDNDVTKLFDEGFDVDLHPPATMADALIRATDRAVAARNAYFYRHRLDDAIIKLTITLKNKESELHRTPPGSAWHRVRLERNALRLALQLAKEERASRRVAA